MPSNHLILCDPLLLLPSVFTSIRDSSNKSVLCIRWPNYWSFSFSTSPSNEYSELIAFRINWFDLLAVEGTLKSLFQHYRASTLWRSAFFMVQLLHPYTLLKGVKSTPSSRGECWLGPKRSTCSFLLGYTDWFSHCLCDPVTAMHSETVVLFQGTWTWKYLAWCYCCYFSTTCKPRISPVKWKNADSSWEMGKNGSLWPQWSLKQNILEDSPILDFLLKWAYKFPYHLSQFSWNVFFHFNRKAS